MASLRACTGVAFLLLAVNPPATIAAPFLAKAAGALDLALLQEARRLVPPTPQTACDFATRAFIDNATQDGGACTVEGDACPLECLVLAKTLLDECSRTDSNLAGPEPGPLRPARYLGGLGYAALQGQCLGVPLAAVLGVAPMELDVAQPSCEDVGTLLVVASLLSGVCGSSGGTPPCSQDCLGLIAATSNACRDTDSIFVSRTSFFSDAESTNKTAAEWFEFLEARNSLACNAAASAAHFCPDSNSLDCEAEFASATAGGGDLAGFCGRCSSEGGVLELLGAEPLRARCRRCCEACSP